MGNNAEKINREKMQMEKVADFLSQNLLRAHRGIVRDMVPLDSESLATCGDDYRIRIYNGTTKSSVNLEGHSKPVNKLLMISFKGKKLLLSSSSDQTVKIWNLKTMKLERSLHTSSLVVGSMDWFQERSLLLLGDQQGKVCLIDFKKLKEISSIFVKAQVWSLAHDGDIRRVFVGTGDGRVLVADLFERRILKTLFPEPSQKIVHKLLAATAFGKRILFAARQGRLHIFDIDENYNELANLLVSKTSIRGLSFNEEDKKVYLTCCDNILRIIWLQLKDGKICFSNLERRMKHKAIQSSLWWQQRRKVVTGDWLGYISINNSK